MANPTFDDKLHDLSLGGFGWMRVPDGFVSRSDTAPSNARSAEGEGRYDYFPTDAFVAIADFAGGVGQGRYVKADTMLSGIFDGRFQGHGFPARAAITASDGGCTSYFFTRA